MARVSSPLALRCACCRPFATPARDLIWIWGCDCRSALCLMGNQHAITDGITMVLRSLTQKTKSRDRLPVKNDGYIRLYILYLFEKFKVLQPKYYPAWEIALYSCSILDDDVSHVWWIFRALVIHYTSEIHWTSTKTELLSWAAIRRIDIDPTLTRGMED